MLNYTLEMAREDIAYAVATFGPETTYADRYESLSGEPYQDQTCRNKVYGEPACIVGVALAHRFGAEKIPDRGSAWSTLISLVDQGLINEVDFAAREYLTNVQDTQDNLETWGQAARASAEVYR